MRRIAGVLLAISMLGVAPLNGPAPGGGDAQAEQKAATSQERQNSSANERGTEASPLVVEMAQPEGHEAIATKAEGEPKGYANPDWWVAGFTGALFLATAGLWCVTWLLWRSTKNLVREEQKNRKIELRAYLSAKATRVVMEPNNVFRILIDITNSGQTPAFEVKDSSGLGHEAAPTPRIFGG